MAVNKARHRACGEAVLRKQEWMGKEDLFFQSVFHQFQIISARQLLLLIIALDAIQKFTQLLIVVVASCYGQCILGQHLDKIGQLNLDQLLLLQCLLPTCTVEAICGHCSHMRESALCTSCVQQSADMALLAA